MLTTEGLNVEQRKRLSIAVELAAKPATLLFLGGVYPNLFDNASLTFSYRRTYFGLGQPDRLVNLYASEEACKQWNGYTMYYPPALCIAFSDI